MRRVRKSSSTVVAFTIAMSAGAILGQEKRNEPGTQIRISGWASDQCGDPVSDAVLTLVTGRRVVATTRTNREGEFAFSPLTPGIYDLRLDAPGSEDLIESINASAAKDIEEKALLVSRVGVVICPSGLPRVHYKKSPLQQSISVYPPEAGRRGTLELPDRCSVALDRGDVQCVVTLDGNGNEPRQHPNGKDLDFWFEVSEKALYFNPQNRTMFANVGTTEARKTGCQAAAYKRNRFRIDTLPPGSHVCVLTGHQRYAELTLGSPAASPSKPLPFAYILWE